MTNTPFRSVISSTRADGWRRPPQDQVVAPFPRRPLRVDDALKPGRVEEREVVEHEHDGAVELLERLRQFTDRPHVEVAADGDDAVVGLDLELTLRTLFIDLHYTTSRTARYRPQQAQHGALDALTVPPLWSTVRRRVGAIVTPRSNRSITRGST